jgi:hypothetical protein
LSLPIFVPILVPIFVDDDPSGGQAEMKIGTQIETKIQKTKIGTKMGKTKRTGTKIPPSPSNHPLRPLAVNIFPCST